MFCANSNHANYVLLANANHYNIGIISESVLLFLFVCRDKIIKVDIPSKESWIQVERLLKDTLPPEVSRLLTQKQSTFGVPYSTEVCKGNNAHSDF